MQNHVQYVPFRISLNEYSTPYAAQNNISSKFVTILRIISMKCGVLYTQLHSSLAFRGGRVRFQHHLHPPPPKKIVLKLYYVTNKEMHIDKIYFIDMHLLVCYISKIFFHSRIWDIQCFIFSVFLGETLWRKLIRSFVLSFFQLSVTSSGTPRRPVPVVKQFRCSYPFKGQVIYF